MNPYYSQQQQFQQPLQYSQPQLGQQGFQQQSQPWQQQQGFFSYPTLHSHGNHPFFWGHDQGNQVYRGEQQQEDHHHGNIIHRGPIMSQVITREPLIQDIVHRRVIEEVQPVIERRVFEPVTCNCIQPIYEKVIESPVILKEERPPQQLPSGGIPGFVQKEAGTTGQQQFIQPSIQQQSFVQQKEWREPQQQFTQTSPRSLSLGQQKAKTEWGWWENQPQGSQLGVVGPLMPPSPPKSYGGQQQQGSRYY